MMHQTIERTNNVVSGIICVATGARLFPIADEYFFSGVAFLCFGIFSIVIGIFKQPAETIWSEKRTRGRIISYVVVFFLLCALRPSIVLGDAYLRLGKLYIESRNMLLAMSSLGLIGDILHLKLNKK